MPQNQNILAIHFSTEGWCHGEKGREKMKVLQRFFLLMASLGVLQAINRQSADSRTNEKLLYAIYSFGILKKVVLLVIKLEHLYEETINTVLSTSLLARRFH